jgi:hypothetical protein
MAQPNTAGTSYKNFGKKKKPRQIIVSHEANKANRLQPKPRR